MDEELNIISQNTRIEKIKNFFIKNKRKIYISFGLLLLILFCIFFYFESSNKKKIKIANKYIQASLNYKKGNNVYYLKEFNEIIESQDSTYAPLALFFLIDNEILNSKEEINQLMDKVISKVNLEKEIKNLMIYKKALINADFQTESNIINILKPLINTESIWKPHSLLLLGDYFLSKGDKNKAKDFYLQILVLKNVDKNILSQAQTRIRRNFSE